MKSWSVKLGKGLGAMKREGIWRGGKKLFDIFQSVIQK